jgi:hypothetical protein
LIVPIYETPPTFRTDQFLAAHDVNVLLRNAIVLDGLANRMEPVFDSTGAYGDQVSLNLHPLGDFLLWRGGVRWETGYEGLLIGGRAANFGSTHLLVTINGVLKANITVVTSWSATIDISTGYAAGEILDIKITTSGNASKTSEFVVIDVYPSPEPTISAAWPGALPTYAGTYTAANLQKLSSACDYIYQRIASIAMMPHLAHVWRNGTHKAQDFTLWTGTVVRNQANEQIRVQGNATINTITESLVIQLDGDTGSSTVTLGPWTAGQSVAIDEAIPYPSGVANGEYVEITITAACAAPVSGPYGPNSRYNLLVLRTEPTAAALVPPDYAAANVSATATQVNTKLNAIATMLTDIKTRIDLTPSLLHGRSMRYKFAVDTHQAEKFVRTYPHAFIRRGSRLIVHGKNVSLGFGAQIFEKDDDGAATYKFKWATEQALTSGEAIETKIVYLDSIQGLFPGTSYFVFGDCIYVAEYL